MRLIKAEVRVILAAVAFGFVGCDGDTGQSESFDAAVDTPGRSAVVLHDKWRSGLSVGLRESVSVLVERFPERHTQSAEQLDGAASWIEQRLEAAGLEPIAEEYDAPVGSQSVLVRNILAEIAGTTNPEKIVVVGAHYDANPHTPGADDNASGVAVALALAEFYAGRPQPFTIRFVLFTNEEMPYFQGEFMGSVVRAKTARERGDEIVAMLSLEMLGYYTAAPVSAEVVGLMRGLGLPVPEDEGFVAVAAWQNSGALVNRVGDLWAGPVPCVPVVAPEAIVSVGFSDQWSYWEAGYPALMVTDTSFLRNPHYHQPTDTVETLNYEKMAEVTESLRVVIGGLAMEVPSNIGSEVQREDSD